MRPRLPFLTLIALLFVSSLPRAMAEPVPVPVIIGGQGVGNFELGKPFSKFEKSLGTPTRTMQSDNATDAHTLYFKRFGLYFFVKRGNINGITVESPLLSTPEGLKVGSDRDQVTHTYGAAQTLRGNDVVYPERGLGFTFADARVVRIYVMDKEARDAVKGDRAIVPGQRVGGLKVGGPVEFVLHAWGEPTKKGPFPNKAGVEMWSYEKSGVIVIVADRRIDGLWIYNGEFRTDKNIHVGSTRADVVKVFGKSKTYQNEMETWPEKGFAVFYEKGVVKQICVKAPGAM